VKSSRAARTSRRDTIPADPRWFEGAVVYELSVRGFFDSDGDGTGDFRGLTSKLDYVRDLGATALWLQPFYPSPLRDDGYDVSDFCSVDPSCGSLADFSAFLRAAHDRGLRVLTEVPFSHTSVDHPWFQRARRAPSGSRDRDFYLWSGDSRRFGDAPVLFDGETSNWTFDRKAGAYYWHRSYAHEPILNFHSPDVRREMARALDFWLSAGVDGIRLGAPSLLFAREGTACENLPEVHDLLRAIRSHVDEAFPGRILLTEADLWPDQVASYFGRGDECQVVAHSPLASRLFEALASEDRYPVMDVLEQTVPSPEGTQWALFLRNHDELGLRRVTIEARDALRRAYAPSPQTRDRGGIRRRLAPLLDNDRRRIELMFGLLLSLPGVPVIYYGDELGMGDNVFLRGRGSVRTPMQWSADRNAGFSRAPAPRVFRPPVQDREFSFATVNVGSEASNPHSLLWWTRRALAARQRRAALRRGSLQVLHPENRKIIAFQRTHQDDDTVVVVANLSRHAQWVDLDLEALQGRRPVELFGQTEFPPVTEKPYRLSLGPYGFYWFALDAAAHGQSSGPRRTLPVLAVEGGWEAVLAPGARGSLEAVLPDFLRSQRWFRSKARSIRGVELLDAVRVPLDESAAYLALIKVSYAQGESESYALPLAFAGGEAAGRIGREMGGAAIADLKASPEAGVLYGAERSPRFAAALLETISRRGRLRGATGDVVATTTRALPGDSLGAEGLEPSVLTAEQSNTSIRYGRRYMLKLFRHVESGTSPDLEIGRFLTEEAAFPHSPAVCGALEYRLHDGPPAALAILQAFVPNEGDAWSYTLDAMARYLESLAASPEGGHGPHPPVDSSFRDLAAAPVSGEARRRVGSYLDSAALLGRRTAELHLALASSDDDEAFAPEPFTEDDQRSLHQSVRRLSASVFDLLKHRRDSLPEGTRRAADALLARRDDVAGRFQPLVGGAIGGERIRVHGDYHLGQVLWTGGDFMIIDFEGEPARPLAVRQSKQSPLRDVAGMLRSFHYAAYQGLVSHRAAAGSTPGGNPGLEAWADAWHRWVGAAYLRGYLEAGAGATFLPAREDDLEVLLVVHLLEKAIYELGYELNNRPDWAILPLLGIAHLLDEPHGAQPKGGSA
jgi:maltose alpha-D-glucosyltransferase / alpha-amylase